MALSMKTKFHNYWNKMALGKRKITPADMHHVCDCSQCQAEFIKALQYNHLKITPEIMAAITADDFRQEVVRALCLRAVAAGVGN